ncbi:MerC domain-containing protein [Formosa algae]|uniref:MerC domain-containing protein n=1 Tax=Formosa algae TaxID=225843 RepID=A0A9X0YRH3_9FLAO|nr:MerC domain-containing protein [Formosa algae]MBP1841643.1 hypothetical protein [Formosa algae]MDQ0337156.1 hypothetical protein [Formosa algae]OEI80627.1 hypothetical protein AST99_08180 [Formosa algae]
MILLKEKPDSVGAIASTLCLIHCIATPVLFMVQSCALDGCQADAVPTWWGFIDYVFLVIAFFSIYRSTKTTTLYWIKPAFWLSFLMLLFVILNEKNTWFYLNENYIYVPALSLIALHLYNRKYCTCNQVKCCAYEG